MTSSPEPRSGPSSISETLGGDHDKIDQMLAQVLAATRFGDWGGAGDELGRLLAHLRRHFAIEEEIVFPLFDERLKTMGPTRILRREHRMLVNGLDRVLCAIRACSMTDFDASLRCVDELFPHHMAKEENILYPAVDRALSDDEQMLLIERIGRRLDTAAPP